MSGLSSIQQGLPQFYDKESGSKLYAVISAFGHNVDERNSFIDRMNAMIGVDTTYDEDLEYRWGTLLQLSKRYDESYESYRSRLKMQFMAMKGGTAEAIQQSVATTIKLYNQTEIDKYINVYDAWEYDGDVDISEIDTSYGNSLVIIDLSVGQSVYDMKQDIIDNVAYVKASGIKVNLVFTQPTIMYYLDMMNFNYEVLLQINYDELG